MQLPVMPQYAYTSVADLEKKIHDVFGLSEVSRGQLPSASIPAAGIQMLLEQDETRVGIEVENHEHAWARIGMLILKCAEECYVTPRPLKTKGVGMGYKIKELSGEMLKSNHDAIVIRGSTVPNSKVIHRQEIMNLYTQGLLGNPQDPLVMQEVLGQLQYGDVGKSWKKYHIDKTQIADTIKEIEQELPPEVNKMDNHILHIQEKNDYRIEKGELLSSLAMKLLEADIDAHAQAQSLLINPQLAHPPMMPPPPPPPDVRAAAAGAAGHFDGGPLPLQGAPQAPPPGPMGV